MWEEEAGGMASEGGRAFERTLPVLLVSSGRPRVPVRVATATGFDLTGSCTISISESESVSFPEPLWVSREATGCNFAARRAVSRSNVNHVRGSAAN